MLHPTIREEIKKAMLAKDAVRLETVRGILAACTNELVAKKRTPQEMLSDDEVLIVIRRLAKQRRDSIEQFEKGNRADLAEKEKQELAILEAFLPAMIGEEEITKIALAKKEELGIAAGDASKIGVLTGAVMKELKGSADGAMVKKVVEGLI